MKKRRRCLVFDRNALLLPIRKAEPTGLDMRLENPINPLYLKMKDARFAARTAERQHAHGGEAGDAHAQWAAVLKLGNKILIEHSKDLEVAAWMTEALLRERGFSGLTDGFNLLHSLIELFWEDLYPTLDEDGVASKIVSLTGLNGEETDGTLIVPIAMIPLTQGRTVEPFALWQWQQAQRGTQDTKILEAIQLAVRETPPLFFHQLREDLFACKQAFLQLTTILDERCAEDAPPTSRIRVQLDACLECIHMIAKDIVGVPPVKQTQTEPTDPIVAIATESIDSAVAISMPLMESGTREQVLQSLLHAADFFRRTEPHSPLSYILERTVRWGRMPLPELLQELVRDEPALGHIRSLTGIEQ
jgi:type VI secretion system protein ImpA